MKRIAMFFALFLLPIGVTYAHANHADTGEKSYVEQLVEANKKGWTYPLLSTQGTFGDSFAYMMQQGMVNYLKLEDPILGYKAGLTSTAGQKKFSVSGPMMGALFTSGNFRTSKPIDSKNFHKLMLETEIGFIVKHDIKNKVTTENVMTHIEAVVPVIELPDLAYADMKQVKGIDLIATNVASNGVIIGNPINEFSKINLNELKTQLTRDEQMVSTGKGNDASGDQVQALTWLINRILTQGYKIEKGHLLITGALGGMKPALPGSYHADFDDLGSIEFQIN